MILAPERDLRLTTVRRGGTLTGEVRALVLDDQQRRNALCWNVFD